MDDMSEQSVREAEYRKSAERLTALVDMSLEHDREFPNCGAHPMCIGPESVMGIAAAASLDPQGLLSLIFVAIREHGKFRNRVADLERRLDVQRDMYADLARTAEVLTEELAGERARAEVAEAELGKALAELTLWDDAADIIGPVIPLDEP